MLSPAGDAQNPGRTLFDSFERGVARQLTEALKKKLESELDARVVLTHEAGETVTQEQKATFANRLKVDLYLALSVIPGDRLTLSSLYYKTSNVPLQPSNKLSLYPSTQAYLFNAQKTAPWAPFFAKQSTTSLLYTRALGAPIKSLEGILAPAFDVELTIMALGDVYSYLDPLSAAVKDMFNEQ